jgi:uncharacterized protein
MTPEKNKELITATWRAFGKGDLNAALANLSDNASWLVPGNLPNVSGLKKGKQAIVQFLGGIGQAFPQGLQSEIHKMYCDGDTVIAEMTNRGKASNGKHYENEYCFVFEIEGGKIRRIREYVDTQKAMQILFS